MHYYENWIMSISTSLICTLPNIFFGYSLSFLFRIV